MVEKIAIILLNYFGSNLCFNCVSGIQKEFNSLATVFLIDNSANKQERKALEKHFKNDQIVNLFFSPYNLGFAAGVNYGIKIAIKQGYNKFFLLNNDTLLVEGSGQSFIEAFSQNPCTLLAPIIIWDKNYNSYNYYNYYLAMIIRNKPINFPGWFPYFTGCALMFDLEVVKKIGLFNELFFMYGEDIEFCYRALQMSVPLQLIPIKSIEHSGSESSKISSFFYEYHMNRCHLILNFLLKRNFVYSLLTIVLKIPLLLVRSLIRCLRYKSFVPVAALFISIFPLRIRPNSRARKE